jgi:hypothetical protein
VPQLLDLPAQAPDFGLELLDLAAELGDAVLARRRPAGAPGAQVGHVPLEGPELRHGDAAHREQRRE